MKPNNKRQFQNLQNVFDGFIILGKEDCNEGDFPWDCGNQSLTDFCGITAAIENQTYGVLEIGNNLYNPTLTDILNANCSQ